MTTPAKEIQLRGDSILQLPFLPPRSLYGAKLGDLQDVNATDATDGKVVTRQADGTFAMESAIADAAAVRAQLDVSQSQQVMYLPGRYYSSQDPLSFGNTLAVVPNVLYLCPLHIDADVEWDEIYLHVATGAEGNCRLGIYTGGVTDGTLTRVVDGGVVSVVTTGTKSITGLEFSAKKGELLWLAFLPGVNFSVTGCPLVSIRNRAFRSTGTATTALTAFVRVDADYASGLPATESSEWTSVAGTVPTIGLRRV